MKIKSIKKIQLLFENNILWIFSAAASIQNMIFNYYESKLIMKEVKEHVFKYKQSTCVRIETLEPQ